MNALGPSWKPKLAGILTPIVPVVLWMFLTQVCKLTEATSTEISTAVLGALVSFGLMNAKAHDVSNSPTPLAAAQAVTSTLAAVAVVANVPAVAQAVAVATTVEQVVTQPVPAETIPLPRKF